uniref:ribosomal protein S11 n=1 Tax=Phytopythium vexans TaxID=907947 RepID=UPI002027D29A|nr:ribosomal protein S11 [Phytopythium vexans]YP_010395059.1 ribosomal protein S11 [Phytopythium vexans]DAZ89470.1 TPA_asm: ribosomal protein S11 [Phytopythium vexans]DAZ89496.1 TPA_asm: ribosomal protein S11 [Phytopythium vexans]
MIKKKYKNKNPLILGNLYVKCSLKNTIISLTKYNGELLKQWSTKSLKKTKFKKNTPYNVQLIVYKINKFIQLKKIKKLNIYFNGTGLGRFNILKNIKKNKIKIGYIFDKTSKPFNGCRIKKMKRR